MTQPDAAQKLTAAATTTAQSVRSDTDEQAQSLKREIAGFADRYQLKEPAARELHVLVDAAVRERLEQMVDIRVGRVLGSALAHL